MGRAPCCDKANVKRGPWSPEEDAKLKSYIQDQGTGGNWIALPQKIGLKRCGKSCRLRWLNYLRPNIKHGGFSDEEDNIICTLYMTIGSRWSIIAAQLPGRTDNDIKNYWNTRLKKKLLGKQRKQVLQQARCYTYVKQENIKTENFMAPEPTNLHPAAYCLPEPPHVAAATMSNPNPNPNQEPLPHLQQNSSITASNFHHPYHLSSIPQDHQQYHNINPMSLPPYNLTFTNNFQLPNTHYSNDFQGYVNNYPVGPDDTIYGLESALSGVMDRVISGSVNGTSTSAESTTSWGGDISSFVCSPMVSSIYEDEHRQGIWGFEEPIGTSGFNNQCTI